MKTMLSLLCTLPGEKRSRGKGLSGITVIFCCLLFAFATPARLLGQVPKADGSFQWTWMGGNNTVNSKGGWAGVYNTTAGVYGIPAGSTLPPIPGGRIGAASYADKSGNLWFFGGSGFDAIGSTGFLNDLWKFKPSLNQWTWMSGSKTLGSNAGQSGVYGALGVYGAPGTNVPGGRAEAAIWIDSSGNLWLFGGLGHDANGSYGELNDLWEFNPSLNAWRWMGGSSTLPCVNGNCGQFGVYPDQYGGSGFPGSRFGATTWTDSSGNLWLFGGAGFAASGSNGTLNDLWRFNPSTNQWVWMSGCSSVNISCQSGSSAYSGPGTRHGATSWIDSSDNLWLFGGYGYNADGIWSDLNDLWAFNTTSRTWTSKAVNQPGSSNYPAGRGSASSWMDSGGNLWLFGGTGFDATGANGSFNDLWQFNATSNGWVFVGGSPTVGSTGVYNGTAGLFDPSVTAFPGGRTGAVSWTDSSGNFWLFGGDVVVGVDAYGTVNTNYLNDVWRYQPFETSAPPAATPTFDPPSKSFSRPLTVAISDATPGSTIYYTTDGTTPTTTSSTTSVYSGPITITSTETLKAFAAATGDSNSAAATATYTLIQTTPTPVQTSTPGKWTWMGMSNNNKNDDQPGHYSGASTSTTTLGNFSASNTPGARIGASSWTTGSYFWLFGGMGYALDSSTQTGDLDDAWAYDPTKNEWALMAGLSTIYAATNSGVPPGGRSSASSWMDSSHNNLWLFGGFGFNSGNITAGELNDLWEFTDTSTALFWTNVGGSNPVVNQYGQYLIPGHPGGRDSAASWTDLDGNFWLFGGSGFGSSTSGSSTGYLNDLWKFNPSTNEWTPKGGSNLINQPGTYSGQGKLGLPMGRSGSVSWTDNNGNLWLFGGTYQNAGPHYLNDLWVYDPHSTTNGIQWTLESDISAVSGAVDKPGIYSAATGNIPGARAYAASWTDSSGNLWLFGGNGYDASGHLGYLNDLWVFGSDSKAWTFIGGGSTYNMSGTYGNPGQTSANYNPGARNKAATWIDGNDNLWLFGGDGYDANGKDGYLNDLWEYQLPGPVGRRYRQRQVLQSFTLGGSSASLGVSQGASGTDTLTMTKLNGFTGNVLLAASGLLSGMTASFTPNPTTGTSVLTLTASSSVPTGTYDVTITGSAQIGSTTITGAGELHRVVTVTNAVPTGNMLSASSANVPASGGTQSIAVYSNIDWAAWSSDANGKMTITTANGSGNAPLYFSVTPNTTGAARTFTITILDKNTNGSSKPVPNVIVTINQPAK